MLAGEAIVVNVGKGRDPLAAWAIERGLLVYIGRGARGGWRESVFHNPFRRQDHGRDEATRSTARTRYGAPIFSPSDKVATALAGLFEEVFRWEPAVIQ